MSRALMNVFKSPFLCWALLLPAVLSANSAHAAPGRAAPVSVAPFLDGVFPVRTPHSVESSDWVVEDAFQLSLSNTLTIEPNPDDDRLYVGSRDGVIVSFENDANTTAFEPFMDLSDRVAAVWDGGFLGMAFHPEFGVPGSPSEFTFYAYYSTHCPVTVDHQQIDLAACDPTFPTTFSGGFFNTWLRLSRFTAVWNEVEGVWQGERDSEEPLINMRLYNGSHRGGGMVFGNDGFLYLTIGDQFHYETAQDIVANLEGGTMRMAVDIVDLGDGAWSCPTGTHMPTRRLQDISENAEEMSGLRYCIPDDNPFLSPLGENFEEYFTLGNRNPHRLALDPVTGDLWSGEVGQSSREEINVLVSGGNYGWPFREGKIAGVRAEPESYVGTLTDPVIDFVRDEARAIIGGYVYRGSEYPELQGKFIAGDYVTSNVWAVTLDRATMTAQKEYLGNFDPGALGTMGQDNDGNVFLGSVAAAVPLQKLKRTNDPFEDPPSLLSELGAFVDTATFELSQAALPFSVNPFWSDGAEKYRWVFLPNDGAHDTPEEQITFSENENWAFPFGTVLMKHFDMPHVEGQPEGEARRLETRFLVHGEDSRWYGLSYRWNEEQTDAVLLTGGETEVLSIEGPEGSVREQEWTYPSRSQCLTCHTRGAGGPLGPRTHQLNRVHEYPDSGVSDNQLSTWKSLGMFANPFEDGAEAAFLSAALIDDPSASLEARARSFLDSNCSGCHRPETGNRSQFDARFTTSLPDQALIWGGVIDGLGATDPYLVHPGAPESSLIYLRANTLGETAMPPLAKARVFDEGMEVLYEWIRRTSPDIARSGITYEYFELTNPQMLPDFDVLEPVTTGVVGTFDISPRLRDSNYGFRFRGYVNIPVGGIWTFFTNSDDGSQLLVDDVLVVENDGLHGPEEVSAEVELTAGYHEIEVTFFENGGGEVLDVFYQSPGGTKRPITGITQNIPVPIVNEAPTLTEPSEQSLIEGEAFSLSLEAQDADGDVLFFDAKGLPDGLWIDSESGSIEGVPSEPGSFDAILGVSDGPDVASIVVRFVVAEAPVDPSGSGGASMGGASSDGGASMGGDAATGGNGSTMDPSTGGAEPGMGGLGGFPKDEVSTGGSAVDAGGSSSDDGGCGCVSAGRGEQGSPWTLLFSVASAVALYRRRRQSRSLAA